ALILGGLALTVAIIVVVRRRALPPAPRPTELRPAPPTPEPPAEIVPAPLPPVPPLPSELPLPVEKPQAAPPSYVRARERAELKTGLARPRGGFITRLGKLFVGKAKIDEGLLDRIEEVMFTADLGVKTSQRLIERLRADLSGREIADPETVWDFIRDESAKL